MPATRRTPGLIKWRAGSGRARPAAAASATEGQRRRPTGVACLRPRHARNRAVDAARIAREHRPAGASEEWVARLPELIEAVCADWRLSLDAEDIGAGAVGIVVGCHMEGGREAVLKLCPNHERLSLEANALRVWSNGPAIQLLAHRPGALLLQRARPGTPSRLAPSTLALLLNALHRPTTADRTALRDWRVSIDAAVTRVPGLAALGRELLADGEGRPIRTLHGDLQPANILQHGGAPAVIDPIGIAGPRELDVANAALYNNWGERSSARITRLARLTGTDPAFALRFAQLQAMYGALARD